MRNGAARGKKLALSPPIDQKALPQLEKALYEVAGHYGVSVWIDPAFLPSQLAREEDLKDKAVALLYREEQMLTAYRQLKEQRQQLKDQGLSPAECDAAITPALRDLLGYPR